MKRREFFKNSLLVSGLGLINPMELFNTNNPDKGKAINNQRIAKNVIFMISDGMSSGTLQMSNTYHHLIHGNNNTWISAYQNNFLKRSMMETSSANSLVTDSSAGSSAFGSGHKVNNGVLNIDNQGKEYETLWRKMKKAGKKTGLVTTVSTTHATPAGFIVNSSSRNNEEKIAEEYLQENINVLLGSGLEFFDKDLRSDRKDLFSLFESSNYTVVKNKQALNQIKTGEKLLGIFSKNSLPFSIDYSNNKSSIPSLSEMTQTALNCLNQNNNQGFALMIEAGKVDWAAHANDIPALIHDQLEFDKALAQVLEFVQSDGNTLLIVTSDHGNANPGILYSKDSIKNFNKISKLTCSNEYLLNGINDRFTVNQVIEWIGDMHHWKIAEKDASKILSYYQGIEKEDGLYNYKKLPFQYYSELLKAETDVGWMSMNHTGDFVELGSMGPGSELINGFIQNIDLHNIILKATGNF